MARRRVGRPAAIWCANRCARTTRSARTDRSAATNRTTREVLVVADDAAAAGIGEHGSPRRVVGVVLVHQSSAEQRAHREGEYSRNDLQHDVAGPGEPDHEREDAGRRAAQERSSWSVRTRPTPNVPTWLRCGRVAAARRHKTAPTAQTYEGGQRLHQPLAHPAGPTRGAVPGSVPSKPSASSGPWQWAVGWLRWLSPAPAASPHTPEALPRP